MADQTVIKGDDVIRNSATSFAGSIEKAYERFNEQLSSLWTKQGMSTEERQKFAVQMLHQQTYPEEGMPPRQYTHPEQRVPPQNFGKNSPPDLIGHATENSKNVYNGKSTSAADSAKQHVTEAVAEMLNGVELLNGFELKIKPGDSKPGDKPRCAIPDEGRLQNLENWTKEHLTSLKPDAENKLKTGDIIVCSPKGQELRMPNGDVLMVKPDGSYDLATKNGKVATHTFSDGSKQHRLTYPNGDNITFGNDPVTGQGRIFSIERNGFLLGIEGSE